MLIIRKVQIMNNQKQNIILTGGAGFIASNFLATIAIRPEVAAQYEFHIVDSLTYAGKIERISQLLNQNRHLHFHKIDIRDQASIKSFFESVNPAGILNFAAETHVDNSIQNPMIFVETNVLGTGNLLAASLACFKQNPAFRYLQVSTDEVYGSLTESDPAFTEETPLAPNSPYSASKAGADMLCRSYFETYKLPVVITRCSNNYGKNQHSEKLIPTMISKATKGEQLPVYGTGKNIRDWIHVDDHNEGIWLAFTKGAPGEVYNFGGGAELTNLELVNKIIELTKASPNQISYVTDRLGHDWRYAINFSKATRELGWTPKKHILTHLPDLINEYK